MSKKRVFTDRIRAALASTVIAVGPTPEQGWFYFGVNERRRFYNLLYDPQSSVHQACFCPFHRVCREVRWQTSIGPGAESRCTTSENADAQAAVKIADG
jgi:hypothetical protein